jgi:hypothetical protein
MLLENICQLTKPQQDFADYVLGDGFPWYYQWSTGDEYMFFGHSLMHRDPENRPIMGIINSEYYEICYTILRDFCQQNGIQINTVFRAAINNNGYHPDHMNGIHLDHSGFPHKNFIMYLNEFDGGRTYLFDDGHNLIKEVVPKKNRAVVFEGFPHAHGFCRPNQRRVALVFTFN